MDEILKLDFDKDLSLEEKINIDSIFKQIEQDAKPDECLICSKKISPTCNSHSVPRFCLKNISDKGNVCTFKSLLNIPYSKNYQGINKTGTFYNICNNCDNICFANYENPDNYDTIPNNDMLSQIAMKTYLFNIYNKNKVINLEKLIDINIYSSTDLLAYKKYFSYAKEKKKFYIGFYKKLDYRVPIAFQNRICLFSDLEDTMINNVFSFREKLQDLNICIFPLKNSSIICLFTKDGETKLRKFYKQLKKLSIEDQLSVINYIIFAYSENIYISPQYLNLLENENLKEVARSTLNIINPSKDMIKVAISKFSLSNRSKIPNFLLINMLK